jgi:predicted lipid carrier protein YhbT
MKRKWNDHSTPGEPHVSVLEESLAASCFPISLAISAALRRVARRNPEVFDRLGEFQRAAFLIAPAELPIAFRLEPDAHRGRVTVVSRHDAQPVVARICGPLAELLALFDGSQDADAAFFARTIVVEGDTSAVLALHNTLEAAELSLADLLGAPAFARALLNRGLAVLLRAARPHLAAA